MGNTSLASSRQSLVEQRHLPGMTLNKRILRLTAPFGQTPRLAMVMLLLMLAAGEAIGLTADLPVSGVVRPC